MNKKPKLIVVLGPTATGKTRLGVGLCVKFNGEIVSADSRQVYKGMDVGTGKDLEEYKNISYHLIDVVSPNVRFDLARYQKQAFQAIDDILLREKQPFLIGGTGLYIQAVVDNYNLSDIDPDEKLRKKLNELSVDQIIKRLEKISKLSKKDFQEVAHEKNKRRIVRYLEYCLTTKKSLKNLFKKNKPKYDLLILGLTCSKEELNKKIDKRLLKWLNEEDLLGEVEKLHRQGVSWKRFEEFGLEYKWASFYLQGKIGYQEMQELISCDIKKFAKRQMTWFKRDKRIKWIKNEKQAEKLTKEFLKS